MAEVLWTTRFGLALPAVGVESVRPMQHLPKEIVALWMLATMAHWAYAYGTLIFHLARYALQQVLGL